MELVVLHLFGSAPVCLSYGLIHGFGDGVGIHYHHAVHIAGGSAGGLRQRSCGSKESFLVGVEYCDKGY